MVLPASRGVPRAPWYSGVVSLAFRFRYGTFTLFGKAFQLPSPTSGLSLLATLQPRPQIWGRFGLFPLRSPLLGGSRLISFPSGTEMFHFPEFAPRAYVFSAGCRGIAPGGFPHSDISGSLDV